MNKPVYNLTFQEALEAIMNDNAWAQGENFRDGIIIMAKGGLFINGFDFLHIHDFKTKLSESSKSDFQLTKGAMQQKYRLVSTQFDAERKSLKK